MRSVLAEDTGSVPYLARDAMVRELMRPLRAFLSEEGVTEVVVNRPGEVFIENGPEWRRVELPQLTLARCLSLANAIATYTDQEIGPQKPILSAMLPDGERIQIVVPPAVENDTVSLTIRKPSSSVKTMQEYEGSGAFSRYIWARSPDLNERRSELDPIDRRLIEHLENRRLGQFLADAVKEKKNIAFVGNTGSGKTTLMKTVCREIPTYERVITVEDVRELFLPHANRVHMLYSKGSQGVAQVTPADVIGCNMRMRPGRVLFAELRGGEAFDFLKLLTSGHSGSVTSWHAESCTLAPERYVFMSKENEQAAIYDADALKRLVALTIDVIVHIAAVPVFDEYDNCVRKDRYVTEVHFDPIAKLRARFGDSQIYRA